MRRYIVGLGSSLAFVLAAPAVADAAVRYVSPGGGGAACSQVAPCSLPTGVNSASTNDEVIVTPGTYTVAVALTNASSGLNIHGQQGQPRPLIKSSATTGLLLNGNSIALSDLAIEHTGAATGLFFFSGSSRAERLDVRSSGGEACFFGTGSVFRDSLCLATGNSAEALRTDYAGGPPAIVRYRNLTLIATGATSTGMELRAGNATTTTFNVRNVIAQGTLTDMRVTGSAPGASATATLQNSNYDTVTPVGAGATVTPPGSGTNQTAPPVFADTTLYHQAPGSPTIDAGASDADVGTLDLDGDARLLGAAPDIGADELVPTPPDTAAPNTTITKGPKKKTKKRKATFVFNADETATFTCKLDRKPAAPCASPAKYKRLKKGKHVFTVFATDAAGNADATPATYRWKVKKKKRKR